MTDISGWKDKILFTPGPLTTSKTVKTAMLRDLGSRDFEFIKIIKDIRVKLLEAGQVEGKGYEAIIMQGSGTFSIEAVLSSAIPPDGINFIIINGAYGKRIAKICDILKIKTLIYECPENTTPDLKEIDSVLKKNNDITTVSVIHCETTTGIINPIKEIGEIVSKYKKTYFVDAMSSFGAVPADLDECRIDFLVSSANKCIEGVPGFGFILAKKQSLLKTKGMARTLTLDIYDQWEGLEKNGQFRFTPPTHSLIAFHQALMELEQEGGVESRGARYKLNYQTLIAGMRKMGFKEYLTPEDQGYIITSFRYPLNSNFNFENFYEKLNKLDYVIYPGKVSNADCFRIGNIGRIFPTDVKALLAAIHNVLDEMEVSLL
ncbi:MAG: 2-aminoethylphosphonate--pyruvate transaminase [Spirochaetes bacterium]|nr:2-aminoethylphosphonate--pyruvate transaminase [Spirochaetota bacterium]